MVDQKKQRHGCLTAWLVLMIIASVGFAILNVGTFVILDAVGSAQQDLSAFPDVPDWVFPVLAVLATLVVVCAIALFRWKKWGFYGFVAVSVMATVLNVTTGEEIAPRVSWLVGIVILFGVLQIGEEDKGWPQLQ